MKDNPERLLEEKPIDRFANGFAALVNAKLGGSTSTPHLKVLHADDASWKLLWTVAKRTPTCGTREEWDEEVCFAIPFTAPGSGNVPAGTQLRPAEEKQRYATLRMLLPEAKEELIQVLAAFDAVIYLHNSKLKGAARRLLNSESNDWVLGLLSVATKCAQIVTTMYGRPLEDPVNDPEFSKWFSEYLQEFEKTK